MSGVTERGGLVLFVGTREGQARTVVRAAQNAKGCHLFTKWIPGSITNGQQILGRCEKKVVNEFDKEVPGFEDQLGVKAALKPDLVVCLNPMENYVLLHECGLNNIPTIGIVDTDCNPTWVTYPIPANDDSLRCVQVIAGVLGRAGEEGQKRRLQLAGQGVTTYPATHGLDPPKEEKKSRPARPQRQQQPKALPAEDLNFPDDVEGVDVKQHLEDQKILAEAEKVMKEQGGMTLPEQSSQETAESAAIEEDLDEDDAYSESASSTLDKSLTDENFNSNAIEFAEEDLAQVGGIDQLQQQTSPTPSSEPDVQATQAPEAEDPTPSTEPDVQATQAPDATSDTIPESTFDQVDQVAKELGEEQQHPSEADFPIEEGDAAKDEPPVTSEGVEPSEATTDSVVKEEDPKSKEQK